jgi:hypothetical protein
VGSHSHRFDLATLPTIQPPTLMTIGHVSTSLEMRTETAMQPTVQLEQTPLLMILRICREVSTVSTSQTDIAPCVMRCANLGSASHQPLKTQPSVIQMVARTAAKSPDFNPRTRMSQAMAVPVSLMKTASCVMKCAGLAFESLRSPMTQLSVVQMVVRAAATPLVSKPRTSIKQTTTASQQPLVSLPDPLQLPPHVTVLALVFVNPILDSSAGAVLTRILT